MYISEWSNIMQVDINLEATQIAETWTSSQMKAPGDRQHFRSVQKNRT